MKNLKIGARLGLAFGFILMLMVVMVFIAVTRMAQLNAGTDDIVNDQYPKVIISYTISENLNLNARATRNLLLLKDDAGIKREREAIANQRRAIGVAMDDLEKSITSDKDKEVFLALKSARTGYVADLDAFLKLADEQKNDEATVLLQTQMHATLRTYFERLNTLIEFKSGLLKAAGTDAAATYVNAKWMMLALAAAALALAGVLA